MKIKRYSANPIITPEDVKPYHDGFEVIGAFNASVAEYNGEIILLMRVAERPISEDEDVARVPIIDPDTQEVTIKELRKSNNIFDFTDPRTVRAKDKLEGFEYLTSLSYIRLARSTDGKNFTIDDEPFIYPNNIYQTYGVEDARCTKIGDEYYIDFTSVSDKGVVVSLVTTTDFETYEDKGIIFPAENKDVVIFPEKIGDYYYALHRPVPKSVGNLDIWLAQSPDLLHWGNHKHLIGVREETWEEERIGAGLSPIKTKDGWLILYHGAQDSRYSMGALLLDLEDPSNILSRADLPIMEPEMDYEKNGFFSEVVFGCGGLVTEDNTLIMYYGVADTSIAVCEMKIEVILDALKENH